MYNEDTEANTEATGGLGVHTHISPLPPSLPHTLVDRQHTIFTHVLPPPRTRKTSRMFFVNMGTIVAFVCRAMSANPERPNHRTA